MAACKLDFGKDELVAWNKQKECARYRKLQDQKQVRQMLENYWPWENAAETRPRGLKNLRLDGLFPYRDFENAKRFSGTLDLGRPGGGAPNVNRDTGKRMLKTREDPLLRFQWTKELRSSVDNNLRYRTEKTQQEQYRKDLDKLVEEKKRERQREICCKAKRPSREFPEPDRWVTKRYQRLSPLRQNSGKDAGVELVPLMIQKRAPLKIPLGTTDITKHGKGDSKQWDDGQTYLKELLKQMSGKRKCLQEINSSELEGCKRHFDTWNHLWGRPGHGAPRSSLRKGCIEKMLYPRIISVA